MNDEIKTYQRQYYLKNKERLIKNGCVKVTCDLCNKIVSKNNLKRHQKTKLCMKLRPNIQEDEH